MAPMSKYTGHDLPFAFRPLGVIPINVTRLERFHTVLVERKPIFVPL